MAPIFFILNIVYTFRIEEIGVSLVHAGVQIFVSTTLDSHLENESIRSDRAHFPNASPVD